MRLNDLKVDGLRWRSWMDDPVQRADVSMAVAHHAAQDAPVDDHARGLVEGQVVSATSMAARLSWAIRRVMPTTTRVPRAAKARTLAAPMPLLPPVTRTTVTSRA